MTDDLEARLRVEAAKYADDPADVDALVESALARLAWRRARGHKVCDRCKQAKKPEDFGAHAREPDGLRRECRACRSRKQLG